MAEKNIEKPPEVLGVLVGVETRVNRADERLDELSGPQAAAESELAKRIAVNRAFQ